jgi:hypothetical protein
MNVTVMLAVPWLLMALIGTANVPELVGVPLIVAKEVEIPLRVPVEMERLSPGGRFVAVKFDGRLFAQAVYFAKIPTAADAAAFTAVKTGGLWVAVAEPMTNVTSAWLVPPLFAAVMRTGKEPARLGVPVTKPVAVFKVRPGGNPTAE